jgi:hypothetical protein
MPKYLLPRQPGIIMTCCTLHNFIGTRNPNDQIFNGTDAVEPGMSEQPYAYGNNDEAGPSLQNLTNVPRRLRSLILLLLPQKINIGLLVRVMKYTKKSTQNKNVGCTVLTEEHTCNVSVDQRLGVSDRKGAT